MQRTLLRSVAVIVASGCTTAPDETGQRPDAGGLPVSSPDGSPAPSNSGSTSMGAGNDGGDSSAPPLLSNDAGDPVVPVDARHDGGTQNPLCGPGKVPLWGHLYDPQRECFGEFEPLAILCVTREFAETCGDDLEGVFARPSGECVWRPNICRSTPEGWGSAREHECWNALFCSELPPSDAGSSVDASLGFDASSE